MDPWGDAEDCLPLRDQFISSIVSLGDLLCCYGTDHSWEEISQLIIPWQQFLFMVLAFDEEAS